jgi:Family of unknown function (DUF6526)
MAQAPQTRENHVRLDPGFHFFLLPVFAATVIASVVHLYMHRRWETAWLVVVSAAAAFAVVKMRLYSLKVQDRVIRLEERMRLSALLPEGLRGRIGELSEGQLVALRFASDAELPGLVERVLAEKMPRAEIKRQIQSWRPDYWRV